MPALWQYSAFELRKIYQAKSATPVEVVESCFDRISLIEGQVGAFREVFYEQAIVDAQQLSAISQEFRSSMPLYGVPVAIKELFDVKDASGCYGSEVLDNRIATSDAEVVRRIRSAGAVIMGMTRAHEFGWGITTQHRSKGSTFNPWNVDRVPGGSSGGSAAAVAAGMVPIALASDTGGSIRIPAAVCGIYGIKPTYGRIPKRGGVSLAPSMDHPGPVARNLEDLALALRVMSGFDSDDATTLTEPLPTLDVDSTDLANVTVGQCPDLHLRKLAPDYQEHFDRVIQCVAANMGRVKEVTMGEAGQIRPTFATIQMAEAYHVHACEMKIYPLHEEKYGKDVLGRLIQASKVSLSDYLKANRERVKFARAFDSLFETVDVLITPITAAGPSTIGSPDIVDHYGAQTEFRDICMDYTVPQDLLGLPTCAIPVGFDREGLPVGIQITGPKKREDIVFRVASALSKALDWPNDWPLINSSS
ncbi:MAG: hypothetical protein CL398_05810 [Acidiferrobacteraceae bacterium]|nr:hypothetical protein [Acidiferrobacteraceae bacterium]